MTASAAAAANADDTATGDLTVQLAYATGLWAAGQLQAARTAFTQCIAAWPHDPVAWANRGSIQQELGHPEQALADYDQCLRLQPALAAAWSYRGITLSKLGRHQQAIDSHLHALSLQPDNAEAHSHLGAALQADNRWDAALAAYEKAIELDPAHAIAWSNRASALRRFGRQEEAIDSARRCIALQPDFTPAHIHLACGLQAAGKLAEALTVLQKLSHREPDNADLQWNLALQMLQSGDFAGWRHFEARWHVAELGYVRRYSDQPLWLGDSAITGRTLLLHAEQGLGDTLQFCRYAPLLAERGARVILQVQPPLKQLLQSLPGVERVIGDDESPPAFDLHCPLMSLPLAMGTSPESIPNATCYLAADPQRVAHWAHRLGSKDKGRIGLVWSGSTSHTNDHNRSLPLQQLLAALPAGYDYICLQKELRDTDRQALEGNTLGLRYFGSDLVDFTDTAALCTLMDLVISVDTSVAHLAGALGSNVWLLLPANPDYRWMLDRHDSPWYPSLTLLRQSFAGKWDEVLQMIRQTLS